MPEYSQISENKLLKASTNLESFESGQQNPFTINIQFGQRWGWKDKFSGVCFLKERFYLAHEIDWDCASDERNTPGWQQQGWKVQDLI